MKQREMGWIAGLVFLLALVAIPVWYFTGTDDRVAGQVPDNPCDGVPRRAAPVESWIPAVAHSNGVGDSVWRTDVGLLNRSSQPSTVNSTCDTASRSRLVASATVIRPPSSTAKMFNEIGRATCRERV